MEEIAHRLGSVMMEKMAPLDENFARQFFYQIFSTLHFYRNHTKNKAIPTYIMKSCHATFANYIIFIGLPSLIQITDKIQPDIFAMIIKSEGDKVKYVTSPVRDRKYTLIAFS